MGDLPLHERGESSDEVTGALLRDVYKRQPLGQIDQIALMDNALVSTALLRACAQRRIARCV